MIGMQRIINIAILVLLALLAIATAVPVPAKQPKEPEQKKESFADNLLPEVSYRQYLAEVINILENDKEFAERVRKLNNTDTLANQLEFASHTVRSRLDEIKRQEVERLNALEKMLEAKVAAKGDPQKEASVPIYPEVLNLDEGTIQRAHVDHSNPHSFEISDLEKLIRQVTEDLRQVETAKEDEYKRYEMKKEHERRAKLKRIKDKKVRDAEEQKMREETERHRRHKKVHQPGSKEQLKDAWESQDHMERDQFDPKTFFLMHDINGDGHLDITEIEALFSKELDKVYASSNDTTVDKVERQHEMERMRRIALQRVDTNRDMMVSWEEFENWTKNSEYKKDEDWETTEENGDGRPFKEDEFKQFEEEYQREHPDEDEQQQQQQGPPHTENQQAQNVL